VRHVGEQSAEGDDQLCAERLGELDHDLAERAPAEGGLAAGEQDQVPRRAGHPGLVKLDRRPDDLPRLAVDHLHPWPSGLEVVELLRLDRRESAGLQARSDELDRA
jgi:hypothetical protein